MSTASRFRHIRTQVFKMSQQEFADALNQHLPSSRSRSQSTISRWENDGDPLIPDHDDLTAMRELAKARGIKWRDSWLFETPPVKDEKERVA